MKKQALLSVVILAGLLCCSCINDRTYNNHPQTSDIPSNTPAGAVDTEIPTDDTENAIPKEDEVLVYPVAELEIRDTFDGSMYSVFTVTQADGTERCGVIDIHGNTRLNAEYEYLGWCDWHEVLYGSTGWPDTTEYPVYIDEEYRLDNLCGHGGGAHWAYILDCKTNTMYSLSSSEGGASFSEVAAMPTYTPYVKYTGEHPLIYDENYYTNLPYTFEDDSYYEFYDDLAYAKYDAIIYGLTDLEFECEFKNSSNQAVSLGKCSIWYSQFTNDYLRICRNGKYGFVDKNGKDASQFVYEAAEEAYDGKAWVKLDGKWHVIKLG